MTRAANPNVQRWGDLVATLAGSLPVALLLGLMDRVSGGNPAASNSTGARGLFMLHPDTARAIGVDPTQLGDPATSVRAAVALLGARYDQIAAALIAAGLSVPLSESAVWPIALAAYWFGPRDPLAAIELGARTPQQVWNQLAEQGSRMEEFAADVKARAAAYEAAAYQATSEQPGAGAELVDTKALNAWGLLLAAALGGLGLFALYQGQGKGKGKGKGKGRAWI